MSTRTVSYIAFFSAPVAYVLIRFGQSALLSGIGLLILVAGLVSGIIACFRGIKERDPGSRNRGIGTILINSGYLALIGYLIFHVIPEAQGLANDLKAEIDRKQSARQQAPANQ